MPKYRVHFADGKVIEKEAATGTDAKAQARRDQQRELPANTEASHPSLRVDRVEDLSEIKP